MAKHFFEAKTETHQSSLEENLTCFLVISHTLTVKYKAVDYTIMQFLSLCLPKNTIIPGKKQNKTKCYNKNKQTNQPPNSKQE